MTTIGTFIELPELGGSIYYKDPVALVVDLPTTDPAGTVRLVTGTGDLYWYNGTSWVLIGSLIDAIADTDSVDLTNTTGTLTADVRLSTDVADANYILGELAIRSGASPGLRSQIAYSLIRGLLSGTGLITYTAATGVITLSSATIYALFAAGGILSYDGAGTYSLSAATVRALFSGTGLISYDNTTGVFTLSSATVRALLSATAPITYDNTTGVFAIPVATSLANGYLSSTDWSTFNNKEPAIAAGTTTQYWRGDKSFQTLNIAALLAYTDGSSASAGQINEILTASQTSNTTTGVAVSGSYGAVISKSFTAGRWLIQGVAGFNENGATLTTALQCGISASATGAGIDEFDTSLAPFLISSTSDALISTPWVDITIAAPTTYYLNTRFYYTSGTPKHRGKIKGIRIG